MNGISAFRRHRIIARVLAVGALGVALATTAATPSSAVAMKATAVRSSPADHGHEHGHEHGDDHEHGRGDHDEEGDEADCNGLIVLLCV
ncbi:hypothetical protein A6P39_028430 [Streptomyces sp. FXJ1.172]|uniref:hypothetical protein n=1 Tax=Streptomyces sp. FXJ1.172 TaxID=710705 RepID=UPI0007CF9E16|nr:hypothetical protein [Streptomyces sp. FXJ1.172]WEO97626.1 hypothetical protein A6P39_028430 [Streptomyces sp. FXJ1.172]